MGAREDVSRIRRVAVWGIPLWLGLLAFALFLIWDGMVPDIKDLLALAPVVRITPGILLAIPVVILGIIVLILFVMKTIPVDEKVSSPVDKALTWTALSVIPILVVIAFSGLIQSAVMPDLGYTKCNILKGHPNMYFSDWVKNPAWCVQDKSRDWVREQAALRLQATPQ